VGSFFGVYGKFLGKVFEGDFLDKIEWVLAKKANELLWINFVGISSRFLVISVRFLKMWEQAYVLISKS
jgi:hypothetical protein